MTGREALKRLEEKRNSDHRFVKWWRKEEDFLDFEPLDRFVENISANEEIEGFELLTLDDMWNEVQRVCGTRVKRRQDSVGDRVEWEHHGKSGVNKQVCTYSPETLMTILDVETKGNPVDS